MQKVAEREAKGKRSIEEGGKRRVVRVLSQRSRLQLLEFFDFFPFFSGQSAQKRELRGAINPQIERLGGDAVKSRSFLSFDRQTVNPEPSSAITNW